MSLLTNINRLKDIENKLMLPNRKRKEGIN